MYDRRPAFELVVVIVMKNVRNPDGEAGAARFDGREGGVIIDYVVGEQSFVAAAAAEIQGREIVERARSAYAGEEPSIFFIPEMVGISGGSDFDWLALWGGRRALRWVWRRGGRRLRMDAGRNENCEECQGCFREMPGDKLLLHVCSFVARWRLDPGKLLSAL